MQPDGNLPRSEFAFHQVLGPCSTNADVYSGAARLLVSEVVAGDMNMGLMFAYGATGSGKGRDGILTSRVGLHICT